MESASECGRCRVGQVARHCGRAQSGLKGMQEDVLGSREGTGSLFIIVDCLSVWFPASVHCFHCCHRIPPNWFSILAHQVLMESLGVWMDGGAAATDSLSWIAIHSSEGALKLG